MRAAFAAIFAIVLLTPLPSHGQPLEVSFPATPQVADAMPQWARIAFFDADRVASQSSVGKTAAATLDGIRQRRAAEAEERQKTLLAERQKLESAVLSEAARIELAKKIERFQIDLQRFLEDARAELTATQQQLADEFRGKLVPAVERVAKQRGIHMIFLRAESGLFWADPAFDVSDEIARQLDKPADVK